jgi:hypothetical protein
MDDDFFDIDDPIAALLYLDQERERKIREEETEDKDAADDEDDHR